MPAPTADELTFSGDLCYWDYQGNWDWFITKYGDKIKTKDVISLGNMFSNSVLKEIPFVINYKSGYQNPSINVIGNFMEYSQLEKPPIILNYVPINIGSMFIYAEYLKEIPDNYFDTWDFTKRVNYNGTVRENEVFRFCHRLRNTPLSWLTNVKGNTNYNSSYFYSGFH